MMPGNVPAGLARVHKPIIVQFERNLVVLIAFVQPYCTPVRDSTAVLDKFFAWRRAFDRQQLLERPVPSPVSIAAQKVSDHLV